MTAFRLFLAASVAIIAAYTSVTIAHHGLGLFSIFFGDISKFGWPGQFNLDFLGFLLLSGTWTGWRNNFSASGMALGVLAILGGTPFLATYLLVLSYKSGGDIRQMLVGRA